MRDVSASRRAFLRGTSGLLAAGALAACTTTNGVTTISVSAISENVQSIEAGIMALEAAPAVSGLLSSSAVTSFNTALAQIKTVAAEVEANSGGTVSVTTGQGWVTALESAVSAALALITPFSSQLPAAASTVIAAIQTLLPIVEAVVGLTATKRTSLALTAAQARAVIARGV